MKLNIIVTISILALVASATNPSVNLSGCKSERTRDGDAIWCPVTDTSRPCKWQFTDLPEGWTSKGDRIFAPRGSIEDGKLYGFKVSLLDAITNALFYKKALLFNFLGGKLGRIA